jgi:DNA-binding transcriptional regulator YiaG
MLTQRLTKQTAPKFVRGIRGQQSRAEFCGRYGLNKRTLQSWEQGQRCPDTGATVLLKLIKFRPQTVAEMVAALP